MDILQTAEAYATYVQGFRNYAKTTVSSNRSTIRFFVSATGVHTLGCVTKDVAQGFLLYGRAKRNWSVWTYLTNLTRLNVFFAWCLKQGYVSENPFDGMEKPRLEKKLPRRLTRAEAERLLATCQNMRYRDGFQRARSHAIIALMLYAGLRRAEVLNLERAHVDLQAGLLRVVHGKGGKDRNLPINENLTPILETYLKVRDVDGIYNPYFFVSVQPGKPFSERGIRRLFDKLKAHTGLDFSPHALRHTFATLMLEGGCDIYSLSRLMGHSKITTTTIYLAASSELLARSIGKHPLGAQSPAPEPATGHLCRALEAPGYSH